MASQKTLPVASRISNYALAFLREDERQNGLLVAARTWVATEHIMIFIRFTLALDDLAHLFECRVCYDLQE